MEISFKKIVSSLCYIYINIYKYIIKILNWYIYYTSNHILYYIYSNISKNSENFIKLFHMKFAIIYNLNFN